MYLAIPSFREEPQRRDDPWNLVLENAPEVHDVDDPPQADANPSGPSVRRFDLFGCHLQSDILFAYSSSGLIRSSRTTSERRAIRIYHFRQHRNGNQPNEDLTPH